MWGVWLLGQADLAFGDKCRVNSRPVKQTGSLRAEQQHVEKYGCQIR